MNENKLLHAMHILDNSMHVHESSCSRPNAVHALRAYDLAMLQLYDARAPKFMRSTK